MGRVVAERACLELPGSLTARRGLVVHEVGLERNIKVDGSVGRRLALIHPIQEDIIPLVHHNHVAPMCCLQDGERVRIRGQRTQEAGSGVWVDTPKTTVIIW